MTDADSKEQISEAIQKELEDAIRDVGVLLEFLGKASDQQLQVQFDGTRGSKNVNITPPSKTYSELLNRITLIRTSCQQTGEVDGKTLSGDPSLTDRAFLLWAQDFLSALASPATVNSIQLTNSFVNHRFSHSTPPPEISSDRFATYAVDLVYKINRQYWITLIVTIITVFVSIYALSGHQIVDQQKISIAELNNIDTKIADLESHLVNYRIVNRAVVKYLNKVKHLELPYSTVLEAPTPTPTPVSASPSPAVASVSSTLKPIHDKLDAEPQGKVYLCDNVDIISDESSPKLERPSFGPLPNHSNTIMDHTIV